MELMLGNQAIAAGAYEAGALLAAAYPGTPSTEITEYIAKYGDIYSEWAPNEKVALEVAIGGAVGGARSICAMKHVGLNVAADPLFTVAYSGINAGLVVVVADDPGMHSSQNEQDSRYYARSAHIPMLEPSDSAECLAMTKQAFAISERYDTPVLIRLVTRIAHARSLVSLGERENVPLREYTKNPRKFVMMPGNARGRHMAVEQRERLLTQELPTLGLTQVEYIDDQIGVICAGSSYNYVKEALPNASVLKLGMVWPLDETAIRSFAQKVKTLVVVEELEPFFEEAIRAMGITISGKDKTGVQGELSAAKVKELFAGGEKASSIEMQEIPQRPPVLCPGCPHRSLFRILGKRKLTVIGDIGCYTLGALAPLSALDTQLCMGASIGMALGMEKARGREFTKNMVALIGDSTFIHSGITGLIDMVYAGSNATVVIADNAITSMTGQQPNAATGADIHGQSAPQIRLEDICKSVGVSSIRIVDPFQQKELDNILKEETAKDGVSVIISRRPCVLVEKNGGKPYRVDEDRCINCGICRIPGCPAIEKKEHAVNINPSLCNSCGQCAMACPKSAIAQEDMA